MLNGFELSFEALMATDISLKCEKVNYLYNFFNKISFEKGTIVKKIKIPGRPNKPELVNFSKAPKRDNSEIGMIKTIHAICHIEFNAINLALDAIYRFQQMPLKFYQDWAKVAFEEAKHFNLIRNYLVEIGYDYGDFSAHNGLWEITVNTDYDPLVRMALVPRVLEARGLDVTPVIMKKFKKSKFIKMVDILQIIYNDEIGHVKIGNFWYKKLCQDRGLDSIQTFDKLIKKHIGNNLRGPFNEIARIKAGFTKEELEFLNS